MAVRKKDDSIDAPVRFANTVSQMGFTQVPNAVLYNDALSLPARVCYGVLMSLAWRNTDFPHQKKLAQLLCVSERSVRTYITELVDAKLLRVEKRDYGKTNHYIIIDPTANVAASTRQPAAALSGNVLPVNTEDVQTEDNHAVTENAVTGKVRPVDAVWDALVVVCGPVTTVASRSKRNKAVKTVREALSFMGVTDAEDVETEVRRHARRYHDQYPQATLTDTALANQWDSTAGFTQAPVGAKNDEPEGEYLPPEENARRVAAMIAQAGGKGIE